MNIKVGMDMDLKNVDRKDVTLLYKPELGTFDVTLKKDGQAYSICRLELDEADIVYISGGIKYLSDKVDAYVNGTIEELFKRGKKQ